MPLYKGLCKIVGSALLGYFGGLGRVAHVQTPMFSQEINIKLPDIGFWEKTAVSDEKKGSPMARVTVEDCVQLVPNRFDLVLLSAHRARALGSGAELKVGRDKDKNPVVALREIAEQKLDLGGLEEALIKSLQKRIEPEHLESEVAELMAGEQQSWINTMDAAAADDMDDADGDELGDDQEESVEGEDAEIGIAQGSFEDADIKD